jgi:DNA-binding NarL/FixJ family response regulator
MRVFLAEDDAALRGQLAQFLGPLLGVDIVCEAATQQEATDWLDAHPGGWDLALIDLFLASGNGFNILRHCAGRTPRQKVALMSNYVREPVRTRALEAGADAFFDKATQMSELAAFCLSASRSLAQESTDSD